MSRFRSVAIAVAGAVVLAGCSTKADSEGGTGADGLKTDVGVTDDEIVLSVMTDLSGPFKSGGLALAYGHDLWAAEVNENGGICDRTVTLERYDTTFKPDVAIPQYEQMKADTLGIMQLGGSAILAALKERMSTDQVLTGAAGWASVGLDRPEVMMIGQTYDVEMLNGLSWMLEQGQIAEGDVIGAVYVDAEYGQNALLGIQEFAEAHNLTVNASPIASTDTDMTAIVTKLASQDVKAIALATSPAATGSVVIQAQTQGLDVPIIGANQAFAPTLLEDPAVVSGLGNFHMVSSTSPYGSADVPLAAKIAEEYDAAYDDAPSVGINQGYTFGQAWGAVLEEACDSGDMTRAGILAAKEKVTGLDTEGLTGALDFSVPGAPSSREAYILDVDADAPGGLVIAQDLFESEAAKNYKAPHQQ